MSEKIDKVEKALSIASSTFRLYRKLHSDKRTSDGDLKAAKNGQLSVIMEEAIKALADEVRGKEWQPIIEATDEEVIGCIKYQKGKYGEPFSCVYNEESDQYESIRITELKPHLPTHFTPLPTP